MAKNRPEKPDKKRLVEARLGFIFFGVFLAMSTLVVRLGYLQVKTGQQFVQAATSNESDTLPVPASRGWIYDRNHNLLVTDKPTFNIVYTYLSTPGQNNAVIAKRLARALGRTVAAIF